MAAPISFVPLIEIDLNDRCAYVGFGRIQPIANVPARPEPDIQRSMGWRSIHRRGD
jgi:hypothetical protein